MSRYINQFELVKEYISKNYVTNEEFIGCSKEDLIADVRFNTSAKLKTVEEVLGLYLKKAILQEKGGYISI